MPNVKDLIIKYLNEARIMQVATAIDNQPWACTVYFAFDQQCNLYWISKADRRHSQDIKQNPKVAGTIVLPHSYGEDIRGLQFQGTARQINDPKEVVELFASYANRYDCQEEANRIASGQNPHKLYRVKPSLFVLFDEANFLDQARQEWHL